MISYEEEIKNKGVTAFVPKGFSMWPFIKSGKSSCVVIKNTQRLSVFDVALYKKDSVYVLHRVVKVKEDGYIFMGDSQNTTEFVSEENVIGVMDGFFVGKKYIKSDDRRYNKKVRFWYKSKLIKKIMLKLYAIKTKIKTKLKKEKKND